MVLTLTAFGSFIDNDNQDDGSSSGPINLSQLILFLGKAFNQFIPFKQSSVGPLSGTDRSINYVTGNDYNLVWQRSDFPPLLEMMVARSERDGQDVENDMNKYCIVAVNPTPTLRPGTVGGPGGVVWPAYCLFNYVKADGRITGLAVQIYMMVVDSSPSGYINASVEMTYAIPYKYLYQ